MANLTPIPLASKSGQASSPFVTLERLRNMYPVGNPEDSKSPLTLYPTPGLSSWVTVGDGPIRGMHVMGGALWVVSGNELYSVTPGKTTTLIGTITGAGNTHITDNGTHLGITTHGDAYAANGDGVVMLTEQNLGGATYQDGYGIFTKRGSEFFYITAPDDMTTIDALDFSTADAFADNLVTCTSDHRELWLFGETTTEVWSNTGEAAFPFTRSTFIERGCAAEGSVAKADNAVFWLGNDNRVYSAQGYQPARISTPQVEASIASAVSPSSAWSFIYGQDGQLFYVLGFSDRTWVYDITLRRWHERYSEGLGRWRASHHAEFADVHLVGDYATGDIYELSLTTYTDNGDAISREIITPPLHAGTHRASLMELRLDVEAGVGLGTGQGSDPQWALDWTDNAGHTWSDEIWGSPGAIGGYEQQLRWHALGSFRSRTLRFVMTDPVRAVVLSASARVEVSSA